MTKERTAGESAQGYDPFEFWRHFYEVGERSWGQALNQAMGSPAFAEVSGKMLETSLLFQKTMRDGLTAQLASLNLATRDDVTRLGELLVGLEEKLDQLDDRLARLEAREASSRGRVEPAGEATAPGARAGRSTARPGKSSRPAAAEPASAKE